MSHGKQNRNRGIQGEHQALEFLRTQGYQIVDVNFRWRGGEIDIIARDQNTLVFIEVKARHNTKYGAPEESVTPAKQQKIIQTAQKYLKEHPTDLNIRFDVVALLKGVPRLLKNAFTNEV